MNFCESCNIACEGERCPKCGRKKLRAVAEDDFCLIAKENRISGENLKARLEGEGIDCVLAPYGTGVNSKFALPLESCLVYVRYRNSEYVRKILKEESR